MLLSCIVAPTAVGRGAWASIRSWRIVRGCQSGGLHSSETKYPDKPTSNNSERSERYYCAHSKARSGSCGCNSAVCNSSTFLLAFATANADPYMPSASGELVIEAEHFDANTASGSTAWVQVQTPGYVGEGAMQASPDSGLYIGVLSDSNSPRLDFEVEYAEPVFLNAWVRGLGPDWSGDSIRIGVDGDVSTAILMESVPKGGFAWERLRGQLFVPAGVHTISVWMREDGPIVDRLFLTPSWTVPTGDGGPESSRGNAPPESPDNTWPVAQDDTFDVVNDGTSHALSVLADNGNGVDFDPDGDTVSVTSVDSSGSAGGSVTVNASSDGLIYTPANGQTGTDTFDYTISDGNGGTGSATVTVNVTASGSGGSDDSGGSSGSGAYQPDGSGQVVIEAENFDANVSRAGRDWVPVFRSGYVGSSAMHAIPNNNVRIVVEHFEQQSAHGLSRGLPIEPDGQCLGP